MPLGPPPTYESVVGDAGASNSSAPAPSVFEIVVGDSVKHGEGVSAYISYKLRTKTSLAKYKHPVSEVTRRYKDFAWLHDRLTEKNKGIIVPALPEKNAVQKFQMTSDFIDQRRRALQVFINRVAAHPALLESAELEKFLTANDEEWMLEMVRAQAETGGAKQTLNSAVNWFKEVQQSAQQLVSGRSEEVPEDPDYLRVKEYILSLEGHLAEAHRQACRLIKKEQEFGAAMAEFGQAAERMAKFEEGSVHDTFVQVAQRASALAESARHKSDLLGQRFEAPLKEATRTIKSVQVAIHDRAAALAAVQASKNDLDSRKVKLNRLRATPGSKSDKIDEAEREVKAGEDKMRDARSLYEHIVQRMTEELARFQRDRATEMTATLRDFALTQAQLASDSAKAWGSLLAELTSKPTA